MKELNQRRILARFLVLRDSLATTSTENYKNEVIESYDNSCSRPYWNNNGSDLARVITLNDIREQLSFRPKISRPDMKNLGFVKENSCLDYKRIGNADAYSIQSFLGASVMKNIKNSEEFLSKKDSVDIKSIRQKPSRRSSKIKFRKLKRSINLLDMKTSFRQAAIKSRKQRLKSSISAPISSLSDNEYEDSSEVVSNINSRINMKVVKKLGKEIGDNGQRSYTPKKEKRGFFRKKLLGRRNRSINKKIHDCQTDNTNTFIRCKNPDLCAKNGVNRSQKAIGILDQKLSILIDNSCLTSKNLGQDVEKIIQSPECPDAREYWKLIYHGSQNCVPISNNLTLEKTTKISPIIQNTVPTMESVYSRFSNLSSIEDLDIISSSPLAQSTPRLFSRYSNSSEENDNYKVNLDLSLIMESLHKTTVFLEGNSAIERSISRESSKQEFIKKRNLIARSREPKMMKKHPSPSKLELYRLQQALGRLS
ncbi:hypothetical protein OnM2_024058 [Erysiphe neolycopersici]|uniref:Uncharacterized protein n=1 Tax=Erysiphe neolycopersici TaxID=212602 RepID=A0A420I1K1_9PEZI|nr:hypothetical protein OnM2_024058 [Erysiphe neolycopersici]